MREYYQIFTLGFPSKILGYANCPNEAFEKCKNFKSQHGDCGYSFHKVDENGNSLLKSDQ